MYYRKRSVFVLFSALCGIATGGCMCGFDPLGTGGDVSSSALSYDGSLTGSAKTASSTEAQSSASDSARPKLFDASQGLFGSGAVAWLTDLNGIRLKDRNGVEYPTFPIDSAGGFSGLNLPVGS